MKADKVWILVAHAAGARILEVDAARRRFELVREEEHAKGRRKAQDLGTDQPGRTFDSAGQGGRHAMEPDTDPKRVERRKFVHHLAGELAAEIAVGRLDGFYLAAEPRLLGELREALPERAAERLRGEIHKDLANLTLPQLTERLTRELWPEG
jgi:protein required for attachment to host cells